MQVTVLGSGNALPTHRRASSGYLVEWTGGALLLDASAGTFARAVKAGLDPHRLRAVALTHFHPDHSADLPAILFARRQMSGPKDPLALFGPEGTQRLLDAFGGAYGRWMETPVEVRAYPGEIAGLLLEAFPAVHSPEAVCLRLTAGGKTLAYSGDTADGEGVRAACRAADLALLECSAAAPTEGHLTRSECEAIAREAGARRLLLTHLPPETAAGPNLAEDGLVVCL